jgi:hypothetical protein
MKKVSHAVGDVIQEMCSVCEIEQPHIIRTTTKQGTATQIACEKCETITNFTRGVKTSMSTGSSKNASPYDRTRTYRKGQSMTHDKFGRGEVTAIVSSGKMDVLFGDTTRRLLHAQN